MYEVKVKKETSKIIEKYGLGLNKTKIVKVKQILKPAKRGKIVKSRDGKVWGNYHLTTQAFAECLR